MRMVQPYDEGTYYGLLIKGDLCGAMDYIGSFPEMKSVYDRYLSVFQDENYISQGVDEAVNRLLIIYQKYYRDVFYLSVDRDIAAKKLKTALVDFFKLEPTGLTLDEIEESVVSIFLSRKGLHFLGGKTGGYYGPYVWKETQVQDFDVELPDGVEQYRVNLLDGFICKSWLDFLSFGKVGTGGWTDEDGIINCVKASYDLESENFQVSLLKHEAQHAMDLAKYREISQEDLEYRAKLVELICSVERNLLIPFYNEADGTAGGNGHVLAADRIVREFMEHTGQPVEALSKEEIQPVARMLFKQSNEEMERKYQTYP